jgi:undecaprenyl-diphosphatase
MKTIPVWKHAARVWPLALWQLALGGGSALVLTFLFVQLADSVVEDQRTAFDRTVILAIHSLTTPELTSVMLVGTNLGSALILIPLSLGITAWLLLHQRVRVAVLTAIGGLGALGLEAALKALFQRPRPEVFTPLQHATGYSFPSGHTTASVVIYGLLAYLIGQRLHGLSRVLLLLAAISLVVFVALSRVYLGVHYPTDVLGSLLVGSAWLIIALLAIRLAEGDQRQPKAEHESS